jgi:hypothetical protein
MAIGVTRTNGGLHGVVNVDTGVQTTGDESSAVLHSVAGKKLQFVAVVVKNGSSETVDISNELDANEAVEAIVKTVQRDCTIIAYQVEAAGGQISLAVEGTDSVAATYGTAGNQTWAAALQTAIQALGTSVGANTKDVSGSTVTDVGFKLALS